VQTLNPSHLSNLHSPSHLATRLPAHKSRAPRLLYSPAAGPSAEVWTPLLPSRRLPDSLLTSSPPPLLPSHRLPDSLLTSSPSPAHHPESELPYSPAAVQLHELPSQSCLPIHLPPCELRTDSLLRHMGTAHHACMHRHSANVDRESNPSRFPEVGPLESPGRCSLVLQAMTTGDLFSSFSKISAYCCCNKF
jgi:hypothetical protein